MKHAPAYSFLQGIALPGIALKLSSGGAPIVVDAAEIFPAALLAARALKRGGK